MNDNKYIFGHCNNRVNDSCGIISLCGPFLKIWWTIELRIFPMQKLAEKADIINTSGIFTTNKYRLHSRFFITCTFLLPLIFDNIL